MVAIYGLCEHAKPVLLAPQRPKTTSMTSPIALRQTSLHRTAIALTQNSATPRMKLVEKVAFDEGGHTLADPESANGRRENMCVLRRERGLLKRNGHCSDSLEPGLASRHKLRLTRPVCANLMSLLLMTNNHAFSDRRR